MKIGVIADTHIANKTTCLPSEVIQAFKDVDMIIHAGDLVDACVLKQLKNICNDVRAVHGNMDPYELQNNLPTKDIIEAGKFHIGVIHGYGSPKNIIETVSNEFKGVKLDAIIFGHSHSPTNEKKDGILYFNPGSPTDKVFAPFNSYGILNITDTIDAKIIRMQNG